MAARPPNPVKFFLFLLLASLSFAQDDIANIPIADIAKTMEHLLQKNTDLKADLNTTEDDLAESDIAVNGLQIEVNAVTKDRNDQAAAKDDFHNKLDAANKEIGDLKGELSTLKKVIAGAGALIAMAVCILLGLCSKGWMGIVVSVIIIPGIVFAALLAML